jgi:hypothetical protein
LQALGRGHITEFEEAIDKHQEFISKFPTVSKEIGYLKKKVRIVSFLEHVFACKKDDRSLSFERLAGVCAVSD